MPSIDPHPISPSSNAPATRLNRLPKLWARTTGRGLAVGLGVALALGWLPIGFMGSNDQPLIESAEAAEPNAAASNADPSAAPNAAHPTADNLAKRYEEDIQPLVQWYCHDCHADGLTRGGYDFGKIETFADVPDNLKSVIALGKAIRTHTMPPPDKDQPTVEERHKIEQWVHDAVMFRDPANPIDPGAVTLRRLNRTMYANTLRDLLFIDQATADSIALDLPADDTGYGFDHIGDVLSVSPLLLERYLAAADRALDAALLPESALNPTVTHHPGHLMQLEGGGVKPANTFAAFYSNGTGRVRVNVPVRGQYQITLTAHGTQAGDALPKLHLLVDGKDNQAWGVTATEQANPQTIEHTLTLDAGTHMLALQFRNDFYNENAPDGQKDRNLIVHGMDILGPTNIAEADMPRGQTMLFAGVPHPDERKVSEKTSAAKVIQNLAERAYRRPVRLAEMARYVRLYDQARRAGQPYETAIRHALSAVLISPEFLFLVERHPDPTNPQAIYQLNDHELASRLSYFLWSSMPDPELRKLADAGSLQEPAVLAGQVERMLTDAKAKAFVKHFTGQWIQLRNLDLAHPDPDRFGHFVAENADMLRQEVELFFNDVIQNNRPITDLIDSDDIFVNAPLANFYGLPTPNGADETTFVRTQLPADSPRGGVLTSAAVLTLTSHPTRTSPVKRGLFMLENILGAAPPPPPPDVPQIDESPEAIEAMTLRERLEAHLIRPDCRACHTLMDPIGFSLEHFDAVGQFRVNDEGHAIDDKGTLPDGSEFEGAQGLKAMVMARKDWFAETFTEKLMVYALGRGLEPTDEPTKLALAQSLADDGYRIQPLIQAIVQSPAFTQRRGRAIDPSQASQAQPTPNNPHTALAR